MRAHYVDQPRPWKVYQTRTHPVMVALLADPDEPHGVIVEVESQYGEVFTGRTEVFWGYFVRVKDALGREWLGEDRHSLRNAFRKAAEAAHSDGATIMAAGLSRDWRESGLSENSGWGSHPAHPDRYVHMLEPTP